MNPTISADRDHTPTGTIEIVVPYDGHRFFSRTAVDDVTRQTERSGEEPGDVHSTATIGHLVLANAGDTKRLDGEPLAPAHGAMALAIPIRPAGGRGTEQLSTDRHDAALRVEYHPPAPGDFRFPVTIEAHVFDPDDNPLAPEEFRRAPTTRRKKKHGKEDFSFEPVHQVAFSSELRLTFVVHVHWPRRSETEPDARVRRVSLHWPTITSLTENFLRFDMKGDPVVVQYDPARSSLEWRGLPIGTTTPTDPDDPAEEHGDEGGGAEQRAQPVENHEGQRPRRARPSPDEDEPDEAPVPGTGGASRSEPTDRQTPDRDAEEDLLEGRTWPMRSGDITVFVKQPGQLRNQDTMHGEIEVEVDDLFSGIDARLFDACGKRHSKGTLKVRTRLTVAFTLRLTQEFARRAIRAIQILHFDEIVPARSRIDDIAAALRDQGFNVEQYPGTSSRHTPSWVLYASRTEGPNTIEMGLVVDGRLHRTRRRAEASGLPEYTSKMDSGELRITIYGEVPRSSRTLTAEISKLRESLGERFRHVQAQR